MVAKATLFTYFPTKDSLVLHGIWRRRPGGIAARPRPGKTFLEALRAHYRALASAPVPTAERRALITRVRVIWDSPALQGAANDLRYQQRQVLARVLASEYRQPAAGLLAAQIAASLLTLQASYFQRLLDGASPPDANRALAQDTELAFSLLEHDSPTWKESDIRVRGINYDTGTFPASHLTRNTFDQQESPDWPRRLPYMSTTDNIATRIINSAESASAGGLFSLAEAAVLIRSAAAVEAVTAAVDDLASSDADIDPDGLLALARANRLLNEVKEDKERPVHPADKS